MKSVGKTIRSLRDERGLTVRQLAQKANVTYSHLSKIENCKVEPTLDILDRVSFAMGVSLTEIVIKTDLDKKFQEQSEILFKDLQPLFRKFNSLVEKFYNESNSDNGDDNDNNGENGSKLIKPKPKIGGGVNTTDSSAVNKTR